jgi:hypothetical protein
VNSLSAPEERFAHEHVSIKAFEKPLEALLSVISVFVRHDAWALDPCPFVPLFESTSGRAHACAVKVEMCCTTSEAA